MIFAKLPTGINIFGLEIRFYAIIILFGAIMAYYLAKYFTKKAGYDHTILEGVFYLAFPMGIIGARIWYVIAQWNKEFASQPFYTVFEFWKGGLAIQGGAILGILVGVLYVHYRKPHYNVLAIADNVVPCILIGQAIGRWGNFFNQEVYGMTTDSKNWSFLGDWFIEQMTINGEFKMPLFLIESVLNVIGFLLIMFVIARLLKKYLKPGYLIAAYLIWYGIIRAVLEPLRDSEFKMGSNIMASQMMAILFVVAGIALIVGFYFLDKYMKKKALIAEQEYQHYMESTEYEE